MTSSVREPLAGGRMTALIVVLGGLTAFGPLSMDLYLPAFPVLAEELHAGQSRVQLTLTADVVGLVAGQIVLGPLSDAWGRRRLLLGATVVCAVASLFCALAPSAAVLTAWRFVQGFSGGGGIVLARAVAADLTSGVAAARLFSLFMTLSSIAPIVAPVIGGALLVWTGSWPVMFYLLAAVNAALAAAIWVLVPESLRSSSGTPAACGRPAGPSATCSAIACSWAMP
jgi:DHA1 family bicyclomycin/chloramphenicol resistance-like MFS transporter